MGGSPGLSAAITVAFTTVAGSVGALANQYLECEELSKELVLMQEDIVLCEQ